LGRVLRNYLVLDASATDRATRAIEGNLSSTWQFNCL
jgi:hypothetical protein